ncbi:hypothetical protein, partial [Pantoea septica]|uniref:hypothetical protein n=1 Tax=Pantoea septica TaxID=472695 RepID=UPI0028AD06E6
ILIFSPAMGLFYARSQPLSRSIKFLFRAFFTAFDRFAAPLQPRRLMPRIYYKPMPRQGVIYDRTDHRRPYLAARRLYPFY